MGEVKRYDAVHIRYEDKNIRYGEGCEVEMVAAQDYDALRAENAEMVAALKKETDRLDWVFKNHIYVSWISRPPDHVSQTQYSFCASGSIGRLPPLEGPTFRESIDDEINAEKQATESPRKP